MGSTGIFESRSRQNFFQAFFSQLLKVNTTVTESYWFILLSALQIYGFHIFHFHLLQRYGYIANSQHMTSLLLTCWLDSSVGRAVHRYQDTTGPGFNWIPFKLELLSGFQFCNYSSWLSFTNSFIRSSKYMNFIYFTSISSTLRVSITNSQDDQLPVGLNNSVGGALLRHRRGHGFESRSSLCSSSETQGQSVGGGRNGATKIFKNGRKNPWVPSLTGPFPNGFANTGSWLGRKNPLYYSAQSASSNSRITFVCSYTAIVVLPYLSGSCTKIMHAVRESFSLITPCISKCYTEN